MYLVYVLVTMRTRQIAIWKHCEQRCGLFFSVWLIAMQVNSPESGVMNFARILFWAG